MNQISLEWDTVKSAYPMRAPPTGRLTVPQLAAFMDSLGPGNTPCCVQMSHALAAAGCTIGPRSNRRANSPITTSLGRNYYLLAVDEVKWFLTDNYGVGDVLSAGSGGTRPNLAAMKAALNGRTWILVFSDLHLGKHTELWDVDHMHQGDIVDGVFNTAQVLFWDVMITAAA
jgi:hypothetical protein